MDWKRFFPGLQREIGQAANSGYRVYTTRHDRVASAIELYAELSESDRAEFERLVTRHRTTVDRWSYDVRAAALEARTIPDGQPGKSDVAATILIDQSGSLTSENAILVALAVEMIAEAFQRAGVRTEILGFTTRNWQGGMARKDWIARGRPPSPGRLCDLLHIVYKAFETKLETALHHLPLLLLRDFRKENVDGEALIWAAERLEAQQASRRVLLVISDGAPVDDSTLDASGPTILWDHLKVTIDHLSGQPDLVLASIGVHYRASQLYERTMTLTTLAQVPAEAVPFALSLLDP